MNFSEPIRGTRRDQTLPWPLQVDAITPFLKRVPLGLHPHEFREDFAERDVLNFRSLRDTVHLF